MTEHYGVLTVGSVTSGTVTVGEQVTGAGVAASTGIEDHLSGSGPGSTWLVNNAQTVAGDMRMKATPLNVRYHYVVGATANRGFFTIQPSGAFGFDNNPGAFSYAGGTAAAALGLTQAVGALDSASSGFPASAAAYMSNLIQNETSSKFGSFQVTANSSCSWTRPIRAIWRLGLSRLAVSILSCGRRIPPRRQAAWRRPASRSMLGQFFRQVEVCPAAWTYPQ